MRTLDRRAAEEFGIPTLLLMENAGLRVADAARALLGRAEKARVVIAAGRGNNGGDGFVAARRLHNDGCDVRVWVAGALEAVRGDLVVNLEIVRRQAKLEPPLSNLVGGGQAQVVTMFAEVTIWARSTILTTTNSVSARIQIDFADFVDTQTSCTVP